MLNKTMIMKTAIVIFLLGVVQLIACSDDDSAPTNRIVFVDLHDGKAGYNQAFPLDIDEDGVHEFVFNATLMADPIGDHLRFTLVSRLNNEVAGENSNIKVLSANQPIGSTLTFDYDTEVLVIKTTTAEGVTWWGNWQGVQNRYIGIRFRLKGTEYYGWLRVSVDQANEHVVIHDMAYSRGDLPAGAIQEP
jgi:hypothetical protein